MDADRIVASLGGIDGMRNMAAFLAMIRVCEGTNGTNGYRALFGYQVSRDAPLFDSFDAHPQVRASFRQTDGTIGFTTAAGAYQIIFATWDRLRRKLGLPDFSPDSQDRAAIELIGERNASDMVRAGNVKDAISRCSPVWASLPGSIYKQPVRAEAFALAAYTEAGGTVA